MIGTNYYGFLICYGEFKSIEEKGEGGFQLYITL